VVEANTNNHIAVGRTTTLTPVREVAAITMKVVIGPITTTLGAVEIPTLREATVDDFFTIVSDSNNRIPEAAAQQTQRSPGPANIFAGGSTVLGLWCKRCAARTQRKGSIQSERAMDACNDSIGETSSALAAAAAVAAAAAAAVAVAAAVAAAVAEVTILLPTMNVQHGWRTIPACAARKTRDKINRAGTDATPG